MYAVYVLARMCVCARICTCVCVCYCIRLCPSHHMRVRVYTHYTVEVISQSGEHNNGMLCVLMMLSI